MLNDPPALRVACCVAGGGPAGMMLGLLLARVGVEVVVLEKHADFLRDFRGDTLHPSTLDAMHELGLLEALLRRPHDEARELGARIGDESLTIADFSHLPTTCKFLAFMPQWEFLSFLAETAQRSATFSLRMKTAVSDLLVEGERVVGVRAITPEGSFEIHADLVVGADGRNSTVREKSGLEVVDIGAPMDVLWMRVSRGTDDPAQSLGRVDGNRILAMIRRDAYWQCALVIPKGTFATLQERGLPAFREEIARLAPFLSERVSEIASWEDVKLLTVRVDRLARWYRPGLLCIGDAAHAMSPIGGVGINLAIQDAIAAANLLAPSLLDGKATPARLAAVQRRREFPTRVTQRIQVLIQNNVVRRVLGGDGAPAKLPLPLRLLRRWPLLRRVPAYLVGVGVRPERVSARFAAARKESS